jgi:DNA-binding CsgD family transcriptional regulator
VLTRDVVRRLRRAADPTEVGRIFAEVTRRSIGWGSCAFTVAERGVRTEVHAVVASEQWAPGSIDFPEVLRAMDRDLGGLTALLAAHPHTFHSDQVCPPSVLRGTELWERFWRGMQIDQQVCGTLSFQGEPAGYCVVTRAARDPAFTADDMRRLEALRREAERAISATMVLGASDAESTLAILTSTYPTPAFLFDASGSLQWMSDEGMLRLGVAALRVGGGRLIRGNQGLDALSAAAVRFAENAPGDLGASLGASGLVRPGERVVARHFQQGPRALVLLAISPPDGGPRPTQAGALTPGLIPGLSATESVVARLAAEGFSVLNMAVRLGVAETTVRTHLRRTYAKLGVHSRAELSFRLFHPPN